SVASGALMAIFGPAFRRGATWLIIVAVACALNAFVGLGETILMIKRPSVNLVNSATAFALAIGANLVLIPRFGPLGAAIGLLVADAVQGVLRAVEIPWLFGWRWPLRELRKPWIAGLGALPVALIIRLGGGAGVLIQIGAAAAYLAAYLTIWRAVGLDPN